MNQRWVVLQQLTCLAPHITVMHNSGQSKKLMYIVYLSFFIWFANVTSLSYTHCLWGLNAITYIVRF